MCSIGARISANGLEFAIHDVGVDVSERGVKKSLWEAADDFKLKSLPQEHGAVVRVDYKIELHRAKPALTRSAERMFTHRASHAATGAGHGGHVPTVRDVSTAAFLIGLQKIRADNIAVIFRNENLVPV